MKLRDFELKADFKNAVIKVIKQYRKREATYQEISDIFNRDEWDTMSGRGSWHAQTVHRWSDE